jgi:hypothetical protein
LSFCPLTFGYCIVIRFTAFTVYALCIFKHFLVSQTIMFLLLTSVTSNCVCFFEAVVAVIQLPMQSVPITTDVASSNLVHGEVYNIM